jgi:hypothetical protein
MFIAWLFLYKPFILGGFFHELGRYSEVVHSCRTLLRPRDADSPIFGNFPFTAARLPMVWLRGLSFAVEPLWKNTEGSTRRLEKETVANQAQAGRRRIQWHTMNSK